MTMLRRDRLLKMCWRPTLAPTDGYGALRTSQVKRTDEMARRMRFFTDQVIFNLFGSLMWQSRCWGSFRGTTLPCAVASRSALDSAELRVLSSAAAFTTLALGHLLVSEYIVEGSSVQVKKEDLVVGSRLSGEQDLNFDELEVRNSPNSPRLEAPPTFAAEAESC